MVYQQVQYIRFDTVGSAARKPAPVVSVKKAVQPRVRKKRASVICIDPVAVLGIAVAVLMLLTMTVGIVNFANARQEAQHMEQYVQHLAEENAQLRSQYENGYDLEEVEKAALALGMVPKDQVASYDIQITEPAQTETITLWDRIGIFLTGLFA